MDRPLLTTGRQRDFPGLLLLTLLLLGLPVLGILATGQPLSPYLAFPPRPGWIGHAPFSLPVFFSLLSITILCLSPLLLQAMSSMAFRSPQERTRHPFPRWGWLGLAACGLFWALAWTRFSWFGAFQSYTFTPLWLSYVLVMQALCLRASGTCMLYRNTRGFLLLFPTSALFWWVFEYLNRFVQNWSYVGISYGPISYAVHASLCFSTVLPAVVGTRDWLLSFSPIREGFRAFHPLRISWHRCLGWALLLFSCLVLALLAVFPNALFAFLWICPLTLLVSLQTLRGLPHIFSSIVRGDWTRIVASALAALFCGWFWEMWNFMSLARWEYAVPYVDRFHVFAMPLLGYAGYLPFGLECTAVQEWVDRATGFRGEIATKDPVATSRPP